MKINWKKWVQNKYVVASLAFLIWITFINDIDLLFIMKSKAELQELETQLEYYEDQNRIVAEDLNELTSNDNMLEKFARENYFMKKPNEDIFVVKEVVTESN
ncbi:MAG: septum formation initiator family protein [Flavobacteriales bacterium]|nr:septum formation initiator family protein [Flavobacteriales bacterium]